MKWRASGKDSKRGTDAIWFTHWKGHSDFCVDSEESRIKAGARVAHRRLVVSCKRERTEAQTTAVTEVVVRYG